MLGVEPASPLVVGQQLPQGAIHFRPALVEIVAFVRMLRIALPLIFLAATAIDLAEIQVGESTVAMIVVLAILLIVPLATFAVTVVVIAILVAALRTRMTRRGTASIVLVAVVSRRRWIFAVANALVALGENGLVANADLEHIRSR